VEVHKADKNPVAYLKLFHIGDLLLLFSLCTAGHTAGYKGTGTKADLDNHCNQLNTNNERYPGTVLWLDNHSNQLNPNIERCTFTQFHSDVLQQGFWLVIKLVTLLIKKIHVVFPLYCR
jgi:hypothetical protein